MCMANLKTLLLLNPATRDVRNVNCRIRSAGMIAAVAMAFGATPRVTTDSAAKVATPTMAVVGSTLTVAPKNTLLPMCSALAAISSGLVLDVPVMGSECAEFRIHTSAIGSRQAMAAKVLLTLCANRRAANPRVCVDSDFSSGSQGARQREVFGTQCDGLVVGRQYANGTDLNVRSVNEAAYRLVLPQLGTDFHASMTHIDNRQLPPVMSCPI